MLQALGVSPPVTHQSPPGAMPTALSGHVGRLLAGRVPAHHGARCGSFWNPSGCRASSRLVTVPSCPLKAVGMAPTDRTFSYRHWAYATTLARNKSRCDRVGFLLPPAMSLRYPSHALTEPSLRKGAGSSLPGAGQATATIMGSARCPSRSEACWLPRCTGT